MKDNKVTVTVWAGSVMAASIGLALGWPAWALYLLGVVAGVALWEVIRPQGPRRER